MRRAQSTDLALAPGPRGGKTDKLRVTQEILLPEFEIAGRRARQRLPRSPRDYRHPGRAVRLPGGSRAARYAQLVVGRPGRWALIKYELIVTLCSALPGAIGLLLRSKLYPRLLGRAGRNVTFGANVVLRHPHKIRIGNDVVIDDACCLDAKGTDNRGIDIGSGVFIGRGTILNCKNGDIEVDDHANIGFNCEIFSGNRVRLGKNTLVAAYTYIRCRVP